MKMLSGTPPLIVKPSLKVPVLPTDTNGQGCGGKRRKCRSASLLRETAVKVPSRPPKLIDMETSANEYRRCSGAAMQRNFLFGLSMLLVIVSSMGCRICSDAEDLAYPAYGGAWERTVRDQGRVGSVFDPAGGRTSTLVEKDLPPQPDEIERMRDSARDDGAATDEDQESDPFRDDAMDRGRGQDDEKSSDKEAMGPDADAAHDADELDEELRRRRKELQDMELQDIQVFPGEPLPPIL